MKDDTQLARWLAGELEGEELEALKKSPQYPSLVRIKENFGKLEQPQFEGEKMLKTIVSAEKHAMPKVVPLYRKAWFKVAATIVIVLGLAYFITADKEFSAQAGQNMAFRLPDNSEVILNDGSEASYSALSWDKERKVQLEGEAYFKVAKGKKFSVSTPQGIVTVLGTQFNVKARQGRFEVVCYEGRVHVEHKNREFILTPQQGIVFANGTDTGVKAFAITAPQWLNNEIAFNEETLQGVIEEMERQYGVTIETEYRSKQLMSGIVPANDIDAALKAVSRSFHLSVIKSNNGKIILKPVNDSL